MSRAYYVVHDSGSWAVKLEAGRYLERGFGTQQAAINRAKQMAQNQDRRVVVNRRDGATRRHITKYE